MTNLVGLEVDKVIEVLSKESNNKRFVVSVLYHKTKRKRIKNTSLLVIKITEKNKYIEILAG